ncbi:hypothetical protein [Corallococcus sp. RDP092CA]|uniref:hypothetical protein n=1 Tax=Corallococcus sp. RDP092CA TaxID=3109369 RepID=UPI0035B0B30D
MEEDLHAKRVLSLAHVTLGVVHTASLSVHAIGQALEWARGGVQKHGIKQGEYPGPALLTLLGRVSGWLREQLWEKKIWRSICKWPRCSPRSYAAQSSFLSMDSLPA